ncbi:C39 family peptidase [Phormidium pseudopriestleyi FRX01]|uniref:C39 family peptidase n=1 Tax=Phormidium pseudopriestleyi FRX01 TaxID=1759528 RepID=A0ABS3FP33_9CYAN|nr:C39 family peptidase [Phormidium pseudopriestleyi]MBO0348874.1 C39 family peptidase [Phormidium pseudopriestleyi FRX01]
MSLSQSFTFKIIHDTFLKVSTASSSSLIGTQKVAVKAGETVEIKSYELSEGHFRVQLANAIAPVGETGYFYEKHIELIPNLVNCTFNSGNSSEPPPGFGLLTTLETTKIKAKPEDSSQLSDREQAELQAGQTFLITGHACLSSHFLVSLSEEIPGFGSRGYLYHPHVSLKKDGKAIDYDPNAITLTILQTNPFKKQPIDSSKLPPEELYSLKSGEIYGVASYAMEAGHLKISLTENLPQFGNTGYLFPDFVQLNQGSTAISTGFGLTYQGPTEVLVKKPVILKGTYEPQKIANVSVSAEDKFSLPVQLNPSAGTWQVNLNNGFSGAGARWLRLKGTDANGQLIGSDVINITVTTDPATVGEVLTLTIQQDTFFKVSPVDSASLNTQQKVVIKAGMTVKVSRYGLLDGHLKVTLDSPIQPIGEFGYFYEGHVQLSKGSKVFNFNIEDVQISGTPAQMLVTKTTLIKAQPVDSANLSSAQKAELLLGKTLGITGYACTSGHFRVTLSESIPGFGNVGYVYWQHVQIKNRDQVVSYDADALTATIRETTVFKKQPVDAARLSATDKVTLPLGRVYGVASYAIESGHLKASLTEEFPSFGNTGYLFPGHLLMQRGGRTFDPVPNQIELNVPYFSQRDNPRYYWSTCNVTSIAMVFHYYGIRSKRGGQLEDELLQWCFNYAGVGSQTDHSVLSAMVRAYGVKHRFSTTSNWSDVKNELINRRPVVIAGYFTATGHIITIIGYNRQGYIVQDPWGDALTGYSHTEGRRLMYPYSYMDRVCGPDGNVWIHSIQK